MPDALRILSQADLKWVCLYRGSKASRETGEQRRVGLPWSPDIQYWFAKVGDLGLRLDVCSPPLVLIDADRLRQDKPASDAGSGTVVFGDTYIVVEGPENWRAWLAQNNLQSPVTFTASSPGRADGSHLPGGEHWIFRQNPACILRTTFLCEGVQVLANNICRITRDDTIIQDSDFAVMPLELAYAIKAQGAQLAKTEQDKRREGSYGDIDTAFNNLLCELKGELVRKGFTEDAANDAIWELNQGSRDPIDRDRFEETVGRFKGWHVGYMVGEAEYEWAKRVAVEESVQDDDEQIFQRLLMQEKYRTIAIDLGFRKWFSDKLRKPPVVDVVSWEPVDLGPLLGEQAASAIMPNRLVRDDGMGIGYEGATHWVWGEPGHGKTVAALLWAAQEMLAGRHVIWLDLESQARATMQKLLTIMRCTREQIMGYFHLIQPSDPLNALTRAKFLEQMEKFSPSLVVVDACNDFITRQGGNHNDVGPISDLDQQLLTPCKEEGCSVIVIDHVTKNIETRGWPINSGHKKAVAESGLCISRMAAFTRDQPGFSKIVSHKDRNGTWPDGETVGFLVVAYGDAYITCREPSLGMLAAAARDAEVRDKQHADDQESIRRTMILDYVREHDGLMNQTQLGNLLEAQAEEASLGRGFKARSFTDKISAMCERGDEIMKIESADSKPALIRFRAHVIVTESDQSLEN